MNDSQASQGQTAGDREEMMSALFAQVVIQQVDMALMLLGQVPHPQTREVIQDFDAARMFIDTLEMLQVKTKGNLTGEEEQLLKQSLMSLQLAFVEAMKSGTKGKAPTAEPPAAPSAPPTGPRETAQEAAEEASKKKFSKKY